MLMTGPGHIIAGVKDHVMKLSQLVLAGKLISNSPYHGWCCWKQPGPPLLLKVINLSADYPNGRADWPK